MALIDDLKQRYSWLTTGEGGDPTGTIELNDLINEYEAKDFDRDSIKNGMADFYYSVINYSWVKDHYIYGYLSKTLYPKNGGSGLTILVRIVVKDYLSITDDNNFFKNYITIIHNGVVKVIVDNNEILGVEKRFYHPLNSGDKNKYMGILSFSNNIGGLRSQSNFMTVYKSTPGAYGRGTNITPVFTIKNFDLEKLKTEKKLVEGNLTIDLIDNDNIKISDGVNNYEFEFSQFIKPQPEPGPTGPISESKLEKFDGRVKFNFYSNKPSQHFKIVVSDPRTNATKEYFGTTISEKNSGSYIDPTHKESKYDYISIIKLSDVFGNDEIQPNLDYNFIIYHLDESQNVIGTYLETGYFWTLQSDSYINIPVFFKEEVVPTPTPSPNPEQPINLCKCECVCCTNNLCNTLTTNNTTCGCVGQKGDKGDQGERGTDGVRGETGPQGPQGEKGDSISITDILSSEDIVNLKSSVAELKLKIKELQENQFNFIEKIIKFISDFFLKLFKK